MNFGSELECHVPLPNTDTDNLYDHLGMDGTPLKSRP